MNDTATPTTKSATPSQEWQLEFIFYLDIYGLTERPLPS
jgi:hypothetical protein